MMPTKPARMPLHVYTTSKHPLRQYRKNRAVTPPAPAERVVVTAQRATTAASDALEMASCDPGLKPYLRG